MLISRGFALDRRLAGRQARATRGRSAAAACRWSAGGKSGNSWGRAERL